MRPLPLVAASGALSLLVPATAAKAEHISGLDSIFFVSQPTTVDRVTDASYVVGYASKTDYHDRTNGVGGSLTLTANARVTSAAAYGGSVVNSSGMLPFPSGGLAALETGAVNMSGGFAYFLTASDSGTISMSGGRTNFARFNGSSSGSLGGIIGDPSLPTTNGFLEARDSSTVSLTGARIGDEVRAFNGASITASGADVGRDVIARNSARIDLAGSRVGRDLIAFDLGSISDNGSNITRSVTAQGGSMTLEGSTVGESVRSFSGSLALSNVTIAKDLIANTAANMNGGLVNGNVTKGGFGDLSITGGHVVGNVTAPATTANVALSGVTVDGNVSVRNGAIDGTHIGGNLANAGVGTFTTLAVSTSTIEGDLLANGRGAIHFNSGDVTGNAVVGSNGYIEVRGGTIGGDMSNGNFATIAGGTIAGSLNVDVGFVEMRGGRVERNVNTAQGSQFLMSNGAVAGDVLLSGAGLSLSGGAIEGGVSGDGASSVTMTGGHVAAELTLRGTTAANMTGGKANALGAADKAVAIIAGGEVATNVVGIGNSTINMTSGLVSGGVGAKGHAAITLGGGRVNGVATNGAPLGLYADDFATVTVDGAEIVNGAEAAGVAELNLKSGFVAGNVLLRGAASARVGDFEITDKLQATDNAVVTVQGGRVAVGILASESARVTISGGKVGLFGVNASGNAKVDIGGVDGFDNEFGPPVHAGGNSEVAITGGKMLSVSADSTGHVAIAGGTFENYLSTTDSSQAAVSGGRIGIIFAQGSSHLTFRGGELDSAGFNRNTLHARENSFVEVSGGRIHHEIDASGSAEVTLSGGIVGENLLGSGSATLTMTGGTVYGAAIFRENSTFTYSGGKLFLGILDPAAPATLAGAERSIASHALTSSGDEPGIAMLVQDGATLQIVGTDLEAVLVDPEYQGTSTLYRLWGTLADGSPIEGHYFSIQNGTGASFDLLPPSIPEPAHAGLLMLIFSACGSRRRRRAPRLGQAAT